MSSNIYHDSAITHVTGESVYINDMPSDNRMLLGKVVFSKHAHAEIKKIDISKALNIAGIKSILLSKDIPGQNQMGPVIHDEQCLAEKEVVCIGQAIALIAGESYEAITEAEKLIEIDYDVHEAILDIETAIKKNNLIAPPRFIERGNTDKILKKAQNVLKGILNTNGQEHWYLETQTAMAVLCEGKEMKIFASSQNPTETQAIVAEVLGISKNQVEVEVKRMGGGFGGKETQGNHVAAWSALLANATKCPVKIHLFRDDDQIITGKRHRYLSYYEAGFDNSGKILAYKTELNADAGCATDLSMSVLERAMLHADNSYYLPNVKITGKAWRTNLPSNTAFRGFGGPQGMAVIETVIDKIARFLKKDSAEIRFLNFYGQAENNITPYGQIVENNHLQMMYKKLLKSSDYSKRRKEIDQFNNKNEFIKKGLALTPVKFGISFTTSFLNQAGALVHIYTDGTVLVSHGGTEMGQGLHTKILQITSAELGISHDKIKIGATNTSKVPNTSPTAASSGSDLNGMAVKNAIDTLKKRLAESAITGFNKMFSGKPSHIENIGFENNLVFDRKNPERKITFEEIVKKSYFKQISLSSTGYYRTPGIYFDKEKGTGIPFYYFSYGMSVSEVEIDTLTGRHKLLRTDILNDSGDTINKGIDIGQVQGAFIQGVGWVTTEELKWDKNGNLLTHSPDTYKIPTINDIPHDFRVELLTNVPHKGTIRRSKAVGEPPFMLAFSVWLALKDAISAVGNHEIEPDFSLPATYEVILLESEKIRAKR
ncbi:MAG: xanthine dehydrogenase molybdopterin binding subunit [Bacteroidota bacterium]